jgi:hypothetical protein
LKRKGYGSIADVSLCRLDTIGDLGRRKGAILAQDVGDRRADELARVLLVACLPLAFWLWPRRSCCLSRRKLGREAGFGEARQIFVDPTDCFRLFRFEG